MSSLKYIILQLAPYMLLNTCVNLLTSTSYLAPCFQLEIFSLPVQIIRVKSYTDRCVCDATLWELNRLCSLPL